MSFLEKFVLQLSGCCYNLTRADSLLAVRKVLDTGAKGCLKSHLLAKTLNIHILIIKSERDDLAILGRLFRGF